MTKGVVEISFRKLNTEKLNFFSCMLKMIYYGWKGDDVGRVVANISQKGITTLTINKRSSIDFTAPEDPWENKDSIKKIVSSQENSPEHKLKYLQCLLDDVNDVHKNDIKIGQVATEYILYMGERFLLAGDQYSVLSTTTLSSWLELGKKILFNFNNIPQPHAIFIDTSID